MMSTPTTEQLCSAVNNMDRMAQSAFSEIATIAKLALVSLENPETYTDVEAMATALKAIFERATDTENNINAMAEEVGSNYKDPSESRRTAARLKARDATLSGYAA